MRGRFGVGMAVLGVSAVLVTAGCGQKAVEFQPADSSGGAAQPTTTATVTATATVPTSAPSNGVSTDPGSGVVVSRNGSLVCVRGRNGGQACTSGNGVVVVDGATVSNGVIIAGGDGDSVVTTVTPTPTSGKVTLSGAVGWSGTATGTCEGRGTGVRTITADLPGIGRMSVRNVGNGVLNMQVEAKGTRYSMSWVGKDGPVSSSGDRTRIDGARLGRSGNVLVVSGDFNC